MPGFAAVVDGGDYTVEGQQSLEFSDLGDLLQASVDQGMSTEVIAPVQALIRRQIAAGHGKDGLRPHLRGDQEHRRMTHRRHDPRHRHRPGADGAGDGPPAAEGGHPVTVWNRTPPGRTPWSPTGATRAATPADAVAAADLVILSLTDYQAMDDILGPVGDPIGPLAGKVLVNLSSDTPDRTRAAATWAAEHGARLLTGGVMVPAAMVGAEAAYVYYSGPEDVFRAHEPVLRLIGEPRYVGADPGLAQL